MPHYLHAIFSFPFCYVGHVSCSECVQTCLKNGLVCELEGVFLCMQELTPDCSMFCGISHSPIVLRAFQPCSSVWNSTLSLNSLQFFCLKRCLWSVLRCRTPSAICQLGFLSLSFSVLCLRAVEQPFSVQAVMWPRAISLSRASSLTFTSQRYTNTHLIIPSLSLAWRGLVCCPSLSPSTSLCGVFMYLN